MVIIGIDPGNARCGYGVIAKHGPRLAPVAFGCIETLQALPRGERLVIIARELARLLKKWRPEEAAVEDIFFFNNAKTAIAVAEARGVVLATLAKRKTPQFSYTPMQVKQSVAAYGKAGKSQVGKMVMRLLGLPAMPKPDDAADGLAVAICHAHSVRR